MCNKCNCNFFSCPAFIANFWCKASDINLANFSKLLQNQHCLYTSVFWQNLAKNICAWDEIYDVWDELDFKHLPEQFWWLQKSFWKRLLKPPNEPQRPLHGSKLPIFELQNGMSDLSVNWWLFGHRKFGRSLITP